MSTSLKLIGTLPPARLESIELVKPGKLTVTMVRLFHVSTGIDTSFPECPLDAVPADYKVEHSMDGGFGTVRFTFKGRMSLAAADGGGGGGGGGGGETGGDDVVSMEIGLDQVPLGMHPNIASIMSEFKGVLKDGELTFPRNDPTGSGRRKDAEGASVNPLLGVSSYFAPRATYRLRRMRAGNVAKLGFIDEPPGISGGDSPVEGGGSWLKTGVTNKFHGNAVEGEEEWTYAFDGWQEEIYGR